MGSKKFYFLSWNSVLLCYEVEGGKCFLVCEYIFPTWEK